MFKETHTVTPIPSWVILIKLFGMGILLNFIECSIWNEVYIYIYIEAEWFVWNICIINLFKIDLWPCFFPINIFCSEKKLESFN